MYRSSADLHTIATPRFPGESACTTEHVCLSLFSLASFICYLPVCSARSLIESYAVWFLEGFQLPTSAWSRVNYNSCNLWASHICFFWLLPGITTTTCSHLWDGNLFCSFLAKHFSLTLSLWGLLLSGLKRTAVNLSIHFS